MMDSPWFRRNDLLASLTACANTYAKYHVIVYLYAGKIWTHCRVSLFLQPKSICIPPTLMILKRTLDIEYNMGHQIVYCQYYARQTQRADRLEIENFKKVLSTNFQASVF